MRNRVFFHAGVEDSLEANREMGCRISLKMHFLHFYLNCFQKTLVQLVTNKVNDFTETFKQRKHVTKVLKRGNDWGQLLDVIL